MSEDSMLKCLIAFVLGYLVARMMRGNGLSVGGDTKEYGKCTTADDCGGSGTSQCYCNQQPDGPYGYTYCEC